MLTQDQREALIKAGRGDLVIIDKIISTGHAGIDPDGRIVDRREVKDAIPIQENGLLGVPKPAFVPMDEYGKPIK